MEELIQKQEYELAFHFLPSFTESQIEEKRRAIEELISKSGGLVSRYGEVKKIKLAYPIKKEKFSNFGYVEFFAPRDAIEKINKSLFSSDDILRHLVVKKEKAVKAAPKTPRIKVEKPVEEKIAELPQEAGELDKKIEEILEKL